MHGCCTRRKTGRCQGVARMGDYPIVRVDVPMRPNEPRSALTARIVAEVMGELRRAMG